MATKKTTPIETVPLETLVLESTESESTPTEVLQTEVPPEAQPEPIVAAGPGPVSVRPRIRGGAIVWGLIVAATAAAVIWINTSTQRHTDFSIWLGGLTPTALGLIALLALGVFVLLLALLALVRRAQRQ